jgi:hypothetical protein
VCDLYHVALHCTAQPPLCFAFRCCHNRQGSALTPEAKSRAETLLYQGISPAETHQLLALLIPSHPQTLSPIDAAATAVSPGRSQQAFKGVASSAQQQQQQQGKPSAAAVGLAAEACSRPLAQQLQQLVSLCEEEFEQPLVVISPSVTPPVAQLQLLPSTGDNAAAGLGGQQAGSSSSSGSQGVAVGPPLLQPPQYADLHSYVCCAVPTEAAAAAAAAAAGVEGQLLLLVKLPREGLGLQQQQQQLRAVQAVLLQLPEGHTAVAWQFYKGQQLVLLLQGGGPAEDASAAAGELWTHSRGCVLCMLGAVYFSAWV